MSLFPRAPSMMPNIWLESQDCHQFGLCHLYLSFLISSGNVALGYLTYVRGDVAGDEVVPRANQLFVVDTDSDIFSVNIGVTPLCPLRLVEGPGDKSSQLLSKFYLVDVKDQGILMAERIYDGERTRAFKVFQLILDGKDWKLIKEDLGDIALFVGGSSTFALAASSVSGSQAALPITSTFYRTGTV